MFFRFYFVIRFICNISYYKSPRANRITKLYGEENTFGFSIKSLFNKYSTVFITFLLVLSMFVFSFVIRVFERAFYSRRNSELMKLSAWEFQRRIEPTDRKNINHLGDYYNSIWCVFTTIMNIGFGDFYPKTHFGRIAMVFLVIIGTLINALIVVSFISSFEFSPNESKVFTLLERMNLRDEFEKIQINISRVMVRYISIGYRLGKLNEKLKQENALRVSVMERLDEKEENETEEKDKTEKFGLMSDKDYKKILDEIKKFEKLKEKNFILMVREIDKKRRLKK